MSYLSRGQVSKATGLNIETIRFYEKNGLIPVPKRTDAGYRLYTEDIVNRLVFIKRARNAGFSLEEIRNLFLALNDKVVDQQFISDLLKRKIDNIDQEITVLYNTKEFLEKVKGNINNPDKCPVLQTLLQVE